MTAGLRRGDRRGRGAGQGGRRIAALAAAAALLIPATTVARELPATPPLDLAGAAAVAASNRFALDLYARLAARGGDVFLSPVSVSTGLTLAYRGARGRTADELRALLHLSTPPAASLAGEAALLRTLDLAASGRLLRSANALWVQRGLALDRAFAADIARDAAASFHQADYRADPDAARAAVNRWVAARTSGRIEGLLGTDDVAARTRVILVSALFWKGAWAQPFVPGKTRTEPFTGINGRATPVPLMHQEAEFRVAAADGVRAIELPYAAGEIAMDLLLPDDAHALPRLEASLAADGVTRWLARLDAAAPRDTVLTLPKLRLAWRDDLVPVLEALGASAPFTRAADFSGMAALHEGPLLIDKVVHQAVLDVDEAGSEAAAATAVEVALPVAAFSATTPPFVFSADKPFLFVLRDRRTGLILFIGRYVRPSA